MTRAEHLAWAKARALFYADKGDADNCIRSMISDLGKHEGTARSQMIGGVLALDLNRNDSAALRRWVEGFN